MEFANLKAIYVNCYLEKNPLCPAIPPSWWLFPKQIMEKEKVDVEVIRLVDHEGGKWDISQYDGARVNEGEWPQIFQKYLMPIFLLCGAPYG